MNSELIKIAFENKAILDNFKAQIETQQITTAAAPNKSLNNNGLLNILIVVGVIILGYNVYSYYDNKKNLKN